MSVYQEDHDHEEEAASSSSDEEGEMMMGAHAKYLLGRFQNVNRFSRSGRAPRVNMERALSPVRDCYITPPRGNWGDVPTSHAGGALSPLSNATSPEVSNVRQQSAPPPKTTQSRLETFYKQQCEPLLYFFEKMHAAGGVGEPPAWRTPPTPRK